MNRGPGCHMPEPGRAQSAEPPPALDLPKCPDIPFLTTRFNLSASRGQVNVSVRWCFDVASKGWVLFVGFFVFLLDCFVIGDGGCGRCRWSVFVLRWHPRCVGLLRALPLCGAAPAFGLAATLGLFACVCAGIRVMLLVCMRCPCAGRHLLMGWLRRWGCLPVFSLASA